MMKPELKRTWIAALRSGEYTQTRERLCNGESHCCLGVLLEVGNLATKRIDVFGDVCYEVGRHRAVSILPPSLLDDIGLTSEDAAHLMALNDGTSGQEEHTFAQIADWIEKEL